MKLYSRPLSPYSARVRIALHHKGLGFEIIEPDMGWSKDAAFLAVNPMGRIPVLVLDDGTKLVESSVIVGWLDDAHPSPPLLPEGAASRARVRLVTQLAEHDVFGTLMALFVAHDGTARLRWVAAGARDGRSAEIQAGVEAGERVVLNPEGLGDGAAVRDQGE